MIAPDRRRNAPRQQPRDRKPHARRPFRDNPRLILAGILVLALILAAILFFANRSVNLAPDFVSEFVLYALSVADMTMLAALVFVLARNVVKLFVERRRALPFARFRAKLVAVLLAMTLVPAVLVLFVGSELIRNSVQRWFNAPMDEILGSANRIASDYYEYRQRAVGDHARQIARSLNPLDLSAADVAAIQRVVSPEVGEGRVSMVDVYRVVQSGGRAEVSSIVEVADPKVPAGYSRAAADRLAERAASGTVEAMLEPLRSGGELLRAAALVRSRDGATTGVVIASDYLSDELAIRARRMTDSYEAYKQLRVLRRPLTGVYLSFFIMVTLLILVGATWIGLYMAKRITRPVQALAAAAREVGAGRLDHRLEPEAADEFGALIEAFNAMTVEIDASRRKLERSALDLERTNREVEERRRYMETILERIATGVISVDGSGRITTLNPAAARLLGIAGPVTGRPAAEALGTAERQKLHALLSRALGGAADLPAQEIALVRDGRELHLAAVATPLQREDGAAEGAVVVFDDVTPLIREQKVAAWRDVARRLAHEIKNPLTPIQLSAERLRRHFAGAPPATRSLVEECTTAIAGEVEALKALVDEFSQFARMPPPRRVPTDLRALLTSTVALYDGLFHDVAITMRLDPAIAPVQLDPEQFRRVVINLVDNAIEAMERRGELRIETDQDLTNKVARIIIADDGPGIPPAEREKVFLPYYSTKQRGSGLGLAIVRRIVVEHGGSIDVGPNQPRGTRFTIEIPL
ncbi:MAG: ATP-binding protein [Vicinamibacterales bacterium]